MNPTSAYWDELFPFRISFDSDLRFVAFGVSIAKVFPELEIGGLLAEAFVAERPRIPLTLQALKNSNHRLWVVRSRLRNIAIRGQLVRDLDDGGFHLLGSPWVHHADELKEIGLTVRDYAPHDGTADYLFALTLKATTLAELGQTHEKLSAQRDELRLAAERDKNKALELQDALDKLDGAYIELKSVQSQLVQAAKLSAVGEIAAGVAHEINNPAAFLLGNLTALKELVEELDTTFATIRSASTDFCTNDRKIVNTWLSEHNVSESLSDANEMLDDNLIGMHRICSITNDLKNFSRIDRNEIERVQLNDIVESACKIALNEVRQRARLVKDLGQLPEIVADRGRIAQVVLNLLLNASHSIVEGASDANEIRVRTSYADGMLTLTVSDTGCGISEDVQQKIFEPFFTTKARGTGTGLGLSLSAEAIHRHGGQIKVSSVLGEGSQFELRLPQETGLKVTTSRKTVERVKHTKVGCGRLLIIDDEAMVLKSFGRTLAKEFELVKALGGREALAILAKDTAFDMVLCDLVMPDVDGPTVYEKLANLAPHLQKRIVFISGGAFTPRTKDFISETKVLVLEKPIESEELRSVVREVVASK